ncbi:DNA breaking-rejoining protein [Escherichia coli]
MDAITVRKMGKTASINDVDMTVIPGETLAELNALSGPAVSLVVFSSGYRPRRGDRVVYDGQQWTVSVSNMTWISPRWVWVISSGSDIRYN